MSRALDIAYALLHKTAGAGKVIAGTFSGLNRAGNALANQLTEAGVKSETAQLAARASPYVAAALVGNKVRKSETYQRLKAKAKSLYGGQSEEEYQ
jgi:hypothetical protein